MEFQDGTSINGVDKIIFATGYKLSYLFLPFEAVTPQNRLAGFYQHIFRIGDPSLAVIGQVSLSRRFHSQNHRIRNIIEIRANSSAGSSSN